MRMKTAGISHVVHQLLIAAVKPLVDRKAAQMTTESFAHQKAGHNVMSWRYRWDTTRIRGATEARSRPFRKYKE